MKKITLLITVLLITSITFAQKVPCVKNIEHFEKNAKLLPFNMQSSLNNKAPIDTIGWTTGSLPLFCDPTAQVYTYTMGGTGGYWFGTNGTATSDTSSDFWAQSYVNSASIQISGVLAFVSGKYNGSSSPTSVMEASLYLVADDQTIITSTPTFGPGPNVYGETALATASKTITELDTNFLTWNYFQFSSLVSISSVDFSIVTNFKTIREQSDTAYLFCDEIGNGLGLNYTAYCTDPQAYYWVAASLSTLDVNMPVFAVVDNGVGINDPDFYQGMKLSIYPNPVSNIASIDYALQYNSKVSIDIIDMTGKVIRTVDLGSKNIGKYNTTINVKDLASGNYFISLNANGSKLIKKFIVK